MSEDAFARALALQAHAARLGFDWPDLDGVLDKMAEELREFEQARHESPSRQQEELGDLLLTAVNLARHLGVDPAVTLDAATARFAARFSCIEAALDQLPPLGSPARLRAMEVLWQNAKRQGAAHGHDEDA